MRIGNSKYFKGNIHISGCDNLSGHKHLCTCVHMSLWYGFFSPADEYKMAARKQEDIQQRATVVMGIDVIH